jgi:hypothetical protein
MRFKSSLTALYGVGLVAAACATPLITPTAATSTTVAPAATPTTIVRVVDVGAVPVPPTPTLRPPAAQGAPASSPAAPIVSTPTPRPPAVVSPSPAGGQPAVTTAAAAGAPRDGTLVVGTDIAPGTYRSGVGDNCYWERLRGFSGRMTDVIANGTVPQGAAVVTIAPTDAGFTARRCGVWTRIG